MSRRMSRRMSLAAPASMAVERPNGLWSQAPWTQEEIKAYKAVGGWFVKGRHWFADRAAALEAGVQDDL